MKNSLLLVLLSFTFFSNLSAVEIVEKISDHPITTVNWGKPLEGDTRPQLDKEKLAGNVVVVEEFGIKVQDCLSRLKDLNRWAKKAERDKLPLIIVLIHRQNDEPDAAILKELERIHPKIMVRKEGWLPMFHEGMPHAGIFHADGTMAWQAASMGNEFDKILKEVLKGATAK